jgi:hypothetical protein
MVLHHFAGFFLMVLNLFFMMFYLFFVMVMKFFGFVHRMFFFHFDLPLPKIRLALASILALDAGDSLPLFTIWVARAFALAAWLLSGMGYLRSPGSPNVDFFSLLRSFACSFAILFTYAMAMVYFYFIAWMECVTHGYVEIPLFCFD